jgi:hypothetical protein
MSWFLVLLPIAMILGSLLAYRFNGRREIFRFDLVQFLYAFILTPLTFIWGKVLLFLLVKNGLNVGTSEMTYLLLDSMFSLVFLYVFGFELLHSLTKSVSLKVSHDPLYDIFNHLEYFHLWLTHLIVFGGGLLMLTILGIANVFFALDLRLAQSAFYTVLGSGLLTGGLIFVGIWLSDPRQEEGFHFMRMMKILVGLLFTAHVVVYFMFEPKLQATQVLFWWSAFNFTTMVVCSFMSYRSRRAKNWLEKVSDMLKHPGFDFRAQMQQNSKGSNA